MQTVWMIMKKRVTEKIIQPISTTTGAPKSKGEWNQFSHFKWTSTKVIPTEKTCAGYIRPWAKGSRETASVGPTVLHTHLCILPSKSKSQLGVTMQVWHQDSIQCHMLDFRGKGELLRKENFIEWIKGSTLLRSSLINRNNVRTPIQFRKRKAIPESWNISCKGQTYQFLYQ